MAVDYSEPKRLVAYGSSVTKRSTKLFSPTIPLISKEAEGFRIEREGIKQFSTTKLLISKERGYRIWRKDNSSELIITVNSTINRLNFFKNKSILLLPCLNDYSILEKSFSIICSKLKRGKYKFEFYLYVEFKHGATDFSKDWVVYYRKSGNKFVQGFDLTAGYINIFSVPTWCPSINRLRELYYHINNPLKPFNVKTNKEVLLIIEVEDEDKPASPSDMKTAVVDGYKPERTAANGSPVTKGSSSSYKIDSTACASWGGGQGVHNILAGYPLSNKEIFSHKTRGRLSGSGVGGSLQISYFTPRPDAVSSLLITSSYQYVSLMKLCINCRSFSTSAFLNSNRSENPYRVEKTDSEIEFDKDGSEAKAHSEEIMQDIEDVDRAREGDLEAKERLDRKYSHFLNEKITDDQGNLISIEAKLRNLEKSLERDFEQDKDCRDEENRREGRPVSPPLYDETEENSPIPSDQDESPKNNEENDRSGPSNDQGGSGDGPYKFSMNEMIIVALSGLVLELTDMLSNISRFF